MASSGSLAERARSTKSRPQRVVLLYEVWHAAEPDKGYDVKASSPDCRPGRKNK